MPQIEPFSCVLDLAVRFRIENIREYFEVDLQASEVDFPSTRVVKMAASSWEFSVVFHRRIDDYIGIYCSTRELPTTAVPADIRVCGRTPSGRILFNRFATRSFTAESSTHGWGYVLSRYQHWEHDNRLQNYNVIIVTASVRVPAAAPSFCTSGAKEMLYRTMMGQPPSIPIRFLTFSRRSVSGVLSHPRTLLGEGEAFSSGCAYLHEFLESDTPCSIIIEFQSRREPPKDLDFQCYYTDADSDFEDGTQDNCSEGAENANGSSDDNSDDLSDDESEGVDESETGESNTRVSDSDPAVEMSVHEEADSPVLAPDEMQVDESENTGEKQCTYESDDDDLDDDSYIASDSDGDLDSEPFDGDCIVVTGAAAATWEAFLFYLYTGDIVFAPLKSEGLAVREIFINRAKEIHPDAPARCSCKSIYRLAHEMGMKELKTLALDFLTSRLSKRTIISEVFSEFTAKHDEVKTIQVAVLMKQWDQLKDDPELTKKLADIGRYPHAGWIVAELLQKAVSAGAN